ncbi:unnamed protein product [Lathyrus sativus]|nr:unnamed protein product [Lathyrus sativus]
MTRGGVDGFPQRTSTEDTNGESEYVAAIDWRTGIRVSEKPFMSTVILLGWRFCGSRFFVGPQWLFESDDVDVDAKWNNRTARIKVVVGEVIAVVYGGFDDFEVVEFFIVNNGSLLVFVVIVLHGHMVMNGFGVEARGNRVLKLGFLAVLWKKMDEL